MYSQQDLHDLKEYLEKTYRTSLKDSSAANPVHNSSKLSQSTSSSAGWSTPWMWALADSGRNFNSSSSHPTQTVIVNNNSDQVAKNDEPEEKDNSSSSNSSNSNSSDLTAGVIATGVGMTATSMGAGYYLFGKYLDYQEHKQLLARLNRWKELRPYRRRTGSHNSAEEQELDELIQATLGESVNYNSSQWWLQTALFGGGLAIAANYFYLNSVPTFYGTLGMGTLGIGYGLVQKIYHGRGSKTRKEAATRALELINTILAGQQTLPHPPPSYSNKDPDAMGSRPIPRMATTDMEITPGIF